PGTIPLLPGVVPYVRVESLREVGDIGECDLIKGGRRDDAGALLVFLERCLSRTGQINRFDAGPIEACAIECRARTTGGQEGPFECEITMKDPVWTDLGDLHPRAP